MGGGGRWVHRRGEGGSETCPQVLELYGNQLSSLECLCVHPPPLLQHLGVGHNQLLGSSECLFLTSKHW